MSIEEKVKILIVDDQPENLSALEAVLAKLEQNIVTAVVSSKVNTAFPDKLVCMPCAQFLNKTLQKSATKTWTTISGEPNVKRN